jgi:hypothetical protein
MNITRQRIATMLILTFMAQMLLGCASMAAATPEFSPAPGHAALAPPVIESPNPAYAFAQATMDVGQSQLLDLSRKRTKVSLDMSQAANSAALSTQDYNQRQKMDLDYQATVVSLNIAQAAATQKFIAQQTKIARDAAAAAQSSADVATQSARLVNGTQTAQAQAIVDAQVAQTDQALAGLTAYPITATFLANERNVTETSQAQVILNAQEEQTAQAIAVLTANPLTATPLAAAKAALLMQEYDREQQSFVDRVVTPLIPILATLDILLFILAIILAYRRFISMPQPRRFRIASVNVTPRPLLMIDSVIEDPDPSLRPIIPSELIPVIPPRLESENRARVEIVNATEPPVAHWIAEVEHQLANEGGQQL